MFLNINLSLFYWVIGSVKFWKKAVISRDGRDGKSMQETDKMQFDIYKIWFDTELVI